MSVKAMAAVWDCPLAPAEKLILLAMADHADHEGANIYPSVPTIARKTGYTDRTIQRVLRELEAQGIIEIEKYPSQTRLTNTYRINLQTLIVRGDRMSPGGDTGSPGGDTGSPGGVTQDHRGGDTGSPDPSFNHYSDPLVNPRVRAQQPKIEKWLELPRRKTS